MTASGEGYITRKAGPVVPVDVAPDELLSKMRWLREKPVPTDIMHGQPHDHNDKFNKLLFFIKIK